MPSVPIPTSIHLKSYPEIRRSRHETFLSLSQNFAREWKLGIRLTLWKPFALALHIWVTRRIQQDTRRTCPSIRNRHRLQSAVGPIRKVSSLWIIRTSTCSLVNSCLDIFIGPYSIETVLAELARCLSLFSNLHTVQIDVDVASSRRRTFGEFRENLEQTFKKNSYPQICILCCILLQARRVGLRDIRKCPGRVCVLH